MFSSLPLSTVIILHLLVAYIFIVVPFLSARDLRRLKGALNGSNPQGRLQLYRGAILGQGAVLLLMIALVIWGKVPAAQVGLGQP